MKRALSELVDFGNIFETRVGEGADQVRFVDAFGGAELVEIGVLVAQLGIDAAVKDEWVHGNWGLN